MGVLGRLRAFVLGAPPESPVSAHLRAQRALLVDVRRCVAISEAIAVAATARLGQLQPEATRWEARRRRSPPDVAQRVDAVLARLSVDVRDALSALQNAQRSIQEGTERLETCAVEMIRLRQVAAAYRLDVTGVDLLVDEEGIRAEASRSVEALLKPLEYREDEERDFLEALFSELERRGGTIPATAIEA